MTSASVNDKSEEQYNCVDDVSMMAVSDNEDDIEDMKSHLLKAKVTKIERRQSLLLEDIVFLRDELILQKRKQRSSDEMLDQEVLAARYDEAMVRVNELSMQLEESKETVQSYSEKITMLEEQLESEQVERINVSSKDDDHADDYENFKKHVCSELTNIKSYINGIQENDISKTTNSSTPTTLSASTRHKHPTTR